MRVALFAWMGGVALLAACSGASNPLGGKADILADGGGSGSGGGSSTGSGSGGSSSTGSGGTTSCTDGSFCADGSPMQVCTSTTPAGACASIRYTVGQASFTCNGCMDCGVAQAEASQACAATSSGSSGSSGSGSSGSGSSGSGSSGSSGSTSGGNGSSSGSGSSSGAIDAGSGDAVCQAEAASSCIGCCQTAHASGLDVLIADIQACDCGTSGVCQTACATEYCADGTISVSGDACSTCLDASVDPDGGACLSALQTECVANADCFAYITCTNGCPAQ